MNDIFHDSPDPRLTPEQAYEAFSRNQAGLANKLETGVFAADRYEAHNAFHVAVWKYSTDTSRSTYIEPEDRTPVINYVADKIDKEGKAGFADHDVSAEDALGLYRQAYDRYKRLARYRGHDLLQPEQLARVYFPMRDLYRRGATIARSLGDEEEAVTKWQQDWLQYSNGPEEEMQPYDDEYEERSDLYERFLLDKDNNDIWDEVAHHAQHEDERGEVPRYELQTISTNELSDIAGLLRSKTKDEQYVILAQQASNGESWNTVLTGLGDIPLVRTLKRFLGKIVSPEELEANRKSKLPHAVILGGRDIKAIDQMVFSKDRPTKGGHFRASPIAENITVIEPSEAVRAIDENVLADEEHVKFVDGLPAYMPLEGGSQELIVGTRNTEGMDTHTLSDFYLELARVLKHGGVYVESNHTRSVNSTSFIRWKSLLARMIIDTVEDRSIPDRMDPEKEAAILKGLGLTEQIFNLDKRQIRVLVKEGAVKEIGWHMLEGMGDVDRLFGVEVGGKPDEPRFKPQRQTTRNTVVW
jgi:hypothetical protein